MKASTLAFSRLKTLTGTKTAFLASKTFDEHLSFTCTNPHNWTCDIYYENMREEIKQFEFLMDKNLVPK